MIAEDSGNMKIKSGYKIRKIAGENVIVSIGALDVNLTRVTSLNPTSVWLWERLAGEEFSLEDVAGLLCGNYDVEKKTALADARKWIDSLDRAGLIE